MLELLFTGRMLPVTLLICVCAALLCIAAKYTEAKTKHKPRRPRKSQFRRIPAAHPLAILASDTLPRRTRLSAYASPAGRRRRHTKE